jgi:drug/metabolite transporter (DMT)-like permease
LSLADVVLLVANLVYATSYVATRLTLDHIPPATLALLRCVLAALVLWPLLRRHGVGALARGDRGRIAAMGIIGFGAAFALSNAGLARSTAANAALLIIVEPITIILLSSLMLGETLRRRERIGAVLALAGTVLVVANGIPGVSATLAPRWRGDLLLVASGVGYAAYSLIGRHVLRRHPPLPVTALSIFWGTVALLPVAALEWLGGARPVWTAGAAAGTLYLGVVITAIGYLVWNWALERVPAPRAAVFLNVQPMAGVLLGVLVLGDAMTAFTLTGGALIVAGLSLTAKA